MLVEGADNFVGDPGGSQVLEGVGAVRLLRVDHGQAVRRFGAHPVMVGDDKVNSLLRQQARPLHRRGAMIGGDDQVHLPGGDFADCAWGQPVAVLHPMGNEVVGPRPQALKEVVEDRGGRRAVHIVIPNDEDLVPVFDPVVDAPHRRRHSQHQLSRVELLLGGVEESPCFFHVQEVPGRQDLAEYRGNSQAVAQRREGSGINGRGRGRPKALGKARAGGRGGLVHAGFTPATIPRGKFLAV